MKVIDIAYTGYPVRNINRARGFYEKTLGLSPTVYELENGTSWVEYELPSGTLIITDVDPEWQPRSAGPSIALEVDDFEQTMSHLKENGVKIRIELIDSPLCKIGSVEDPEGNAVTIHSKKAGHPDRLKQLHTASAT